MIPTNSVDHSRFPGNDGTRPHTDGPDELRGAVPARTPCMPGTRLIHTDHIVAPAQQIFCSASTLPARSAA